MLEHVVDEHRRRVRTDRQAGEIAAEPVDALLPRLWRTDRQHVEARDRKVRRVRVVPRSRSATRIEHARPGREFGRDLAQEHACVPRPRKRARHEAVAVFHSAQACSLPGTKPEVAGSVPRTPSNHARHAAANAGAPPPLTAHDTLCASRSTGNASGHVKRATLSRASRDAMLARGGTPWTDSPVARPRRGGAARRSARTGSESRGPRPGHQSASSPQIVSLIQEADALEARARDVKRRARQVAARLDACMRGRIRPRPAELAMTPPAQPGRPVSAGRPHLRAVPRQDRRPEQAAFGVRTHGLEQVDEAIRLRPVSLFKRSTPSAPPSSASARPLLLPPPSAGSRHADQAHLRKLRGQALGLPSVEPLSVTRASATPSGTRTERSDSRQAAVSAAPFQFSTTVHTFAGVMRASGPARGRAAAPREGAPPAPCARTAAAPREAPRTRRRGSAGAAGRRRSRTPTTRRARG